MNTVERARLYLSKIPGAISGAGGHTSTFKTALALVHGFALPEDQALDLLREWNSTCQPPWSESDLKHKVRSAGQFRTSKPRGHLLGDSKPFIPPPPKPKLDLSMLRRGTPEELRQLAKLREIGLEGITWAHDRGVLRFGTVKGHLSWIITDKTARCAQARKLDGSTWEHIGGKKAYTLPGSQASWPIGLLEAREFPSIALCEGGPDFLAGHYLALWEQASHHTRRDVRCVPVAMIGASMPIPPEALPHFRNKRIRIFTHADDSGRAAAERWAASIASVGALVDAITFDSGDLNDYCAGPNIDKVLP